VRFDRESMLRRVSLALITVVLIGLLLDPYTFHHDAGDAVMPAPVWQRVLGLVDLSLLAASLSMVWQKRYDGALALLGSETVWAIGSVLVLVNRDGMGRFIRGFGAEPYLTEYLAVMGLRLAAMACLWWVGRSTSSAAVHPAAVHPAA
jgi:hypothetical protein